MWVLQLPMTAARLHLVPASLVQNSQYVTQLRHVTIVRSGAYDVSIQALSR
jgi:hypothetical protein